MEAQSFLKAFTHAMLGSGIQIALGPFGFLYLYVDRQWLKSCKVTHQFADEQVDKTHQSRPSLREEGWELKKESKTTGKPSVLLHGMAEQTSDKTELRNEILQGLMAA